MTAPPVIILTAPKSTCFSDHSSQPLTNNTGAQRREGSGATQCRVTTHVTTATLYSSSLFFPCSYLTNLSSSNWNRGLQRSTHLLLCQPQFFLTYRLCPRACVNITNTPVCATQNLPNVFTISAAPVFARLTLNLVPAPARVDRASTTGPTELPRQEVSSPLTGMHPFSLRPRVAPPMPYPQIMRGPAASAGVPPTPFWQNTWGICPRPPQMPPLAKIPLPTASVSRLPFATGTPALGATTQSRDPRLNRHLHPEFPPAVLPPPDQNRNSLHLLMAMHTPERALQLQMRSDEHGSCREMTKSKSTDSAPNMLSATETSQPGRHETSVCIDTRPVSCTGLSPAERAPILSAVLSSGADSYRPSANPCLDLSTTRDIAHRPDGSVHRTDYQSCTTQPLQDTPYFSSSTIKKPKATWPLSAVAMGSSGQSTPQATRPEEDAASRVTYVNGPPPEQHKSLLRLRLTADPTRKDHWLARVMSSAEPSAFTPVDDQKNVADESAARVTVSQRQSDDGRPFGADVSLPGQTPVGERVASHRGSSVSEVCLTSSSSGTTRLETTYSDTIVQCVSTTTDIDTHRSKKQRGQALENAADSAAGRPLATSDEEKRRKKLKRRKVVQDESGAKRPKLSPRTPQRQDAQPTSPHRASEPIDRDANAVDVPDSSTSRDNDQEEPLWKKYLWPDARTKRAPNHKQVLDEQEDDVFVCVECDHPSCGKTSPPGAHHSVADGAIPDSAAPAVRSQGHRNERGRFAKKKVKKSDCSKRQDNIAPGPNQSHPNRRKRRNSMVILSMDNESRLAETSKKARAEQDQILCWPPVKPDCGNARSVWSSIMCGAEDLMSAPLSFYARDAPTGFNSVDSGYACPQDESFPRLRPRRSNPEDHSDSSPAAGCTRRCLRCGACKCLPCRRYCLSRCGISSLNLNYGSSAACSDHDSAATFFGSNDCTGPQRRPAPRETASMTTGSAKKRGRRSCPPKKTARRKVACPESSSQNAVPLMASTSSPLDTRDFEGACILLQMSGMVGRESAQTFRVSAIA